MPSFVSYGFGRRGDRSSDLQGSDVKGLNEVIDFHERINVTRKNSVWILKAIRHTTVKTNMNTPNPASYILQAQMKDSLHAKRNTKHQIPFPPSRSESTSKLRSWPPLKTRMPPIQILNGLNIHSRQFSIHVSPLSALVIMQHP